MFDDIPGLGRTPAAVTARRARQRAAAARAVAASTGRPEFQPQTGPAEGPLGVAQAADRELGRAFAVRARALAGFALSCSPATDRAQGQPGAMSAVRWAARPEILKQTSEWTAHEVSIGLTCSRSRAENLLTESLTLVQRLPGTLAGLEGGLLTIDHRHPMLDVVAPVRDDGLRAEIEAELLRWVAARAENQTITTPAQLGDKARRLVAKRNARDRAQEALKALRGRGVFRQRERGEGLAGLAGVGTEVEVAALLAALQGYADAAEGEPERGVPPRSQAERMWDCLLHLVLRPGGTPLPLQVTLTVVAGLQTLLGGDGPIEVDGEQISAEAGRQLLRLLTGSPLGAAALAEYAHLAEHAVAEPAAGGSGRGRGHTDAIASDAAVPSERAAGDDRGSDLVSDQDYDDDYDDDDDDDDDDFDEDIEDEGFDDEGAVEPIEGLPDDSALADLADDPFLTPGQRRWLRRLQARYWAEWERRLNAGEFDDPEPMSDAEVLAAAERSVADGWVEEQRAVTEAAERWWAEFEAGLHTDPDPHGDGWLDDAPDPSPNPSPGSGWWTTADRAVDDASRAVLDAQLALDHARRLVHAAETADAVDEQAWRAGPAGRVDAAGDALGALCAAAAADRQALAELLGRTVGGGLTDRPRLALVDALNGALISLTDLPALRRAAHCGRPACTRRPGRCEHDLIGRPGLGAPEPPTATARVPSSTGSCAPATAAAGNPAAASRSRRASWTTGSAGPTAPPR